MGSLDTVGERAFRKRRSYEALIADFRWNTGLGGLGLNREICSVVRENPSALSGSYARSGLPLVGFPIFAVAPKIFSFLEKARTLPDFQGWQEAARKVRPCKQAAV